jgi:hybrid cluster-associated redox disulfide protein
MSDEINKKMTFGEVLEKKPAAAPIMGKYGLHCIGCHIAAIESVEDGCKAHGLSDKDVDKMLKEINDLD